MSCDCIQDNTLWSEWEWRFLTSVVYVLLTKNCYQIIPCLSIRVKLTPERHVLSSMVQSLSRVRLFATAWTAACGVPCPSPPLRLCSDSCALSRWCHPATSSSVTPFSSCLQSFPASGSFHRVAKGLKHQRNSFQWIFSFRMDCLDLLAVQGTLKSLLQHHSSKASFLSAQLSL